MTTGMRAMDHQNPFVPVIYTSTSLLLVALAVAITFVWGRRFRGRSSSSRPNVSHFTRWPWKWPRQTLCPKSQFAKNV